VYLAGIIARCTVTMSSPPAVTDLSCGPGSGKGADYA